MVSCAVFYLRFIIAGVLCGSVDTAVVSFPLLEELLILLVVQLQCMLGAEPKFDQSLFALSSLFVSKVDLPNIHI